MVTCKTSSSWRTPITSLVRARSLAARSYFLPRLLPWFAGVLWSAEMPSTNANLQAKRLHAKARQHFAERLPELRSGILQDRRAKIDDA